MIQTSENYRPFPTVRSPDALISFEVIPKALIKENITAETAASAKMGAVSRTVNGVAELAGKYGTLERYGWKLDGTYSLIPSSGAETGFWTSAVSDGGGAFNEPIKFRYEWDDPIDTFGWTFHFDAPAAVRASQVKIEWFDSEDNKLGRIDGYTEGSEKRLHPFVTAGIEPVQDLHGYSNPWPGGGGKNLCSGVTRYSTTNYVTPIIALTAGQAYTVNFTAASNASAMYLRKKEEIDISGTAEQRTYSGQNRWTFTPQETTTYILQIYKSGTDGWGTETLDNFQLEKGSSATDYEPYSNVCPITGWTGANIVVSPTHDAQDGTTYPISWQTEAGTVYGGTLDATSGVLTVTHGCYTFTGSESWTTNANNVNRYYTTAYLLRNIAKLPADNNHSVPICTSIGEFNQSYYSMTNTTGKICIAADGRIGINSDLYTGTGTLEGVQIVYELVSPVTYQITPADIDYIYSGMNVWADCGPVTVEFLPGDDMIITSDEYGGWSIQRFAQDYCAVEFTFYGTNEPLRMLRLVEIDFGISRRFSADSVTDMRIVYGTSIDASAFPAKELTFTFDNSRGEFNILSPAGVYQYWKNGQVLRAKVKIGDELVNMGMFTESTAEIGKNRLLVKVRAHDQCYHMDRQKYYPDAAMKAASSVTLKTAVEDVLAGYDLKINYNGLENELVSCQVNENHPKRAMIRYLAMAARCSVWIDRENTLQFKRFTAPTPDDAVSEITADELYDWSGVSISEEFSGCVLTVERELEEVDPGVEGTSVGVTYTYTSGESEDTGTNTASYENPCIAPGKEQDVCDWLLTAANWRKKYSVKNRCDPAVEIGDALVIEDAFHNDDAAIVTGLDVTFDGVLSAVTEAAGVLT